MKKSFIVWVTILFAGVNVFSQVKFQIVAEKSDYKSTSDYEDVITFIDQMKKASPYIRIE